MDYLRTNSAKPKDSRETDKQYLQSNNESINSDENKRTTKKFKQKLVSITDSHSNGNTTKYLMYARPGSSTKSKTQILPTWFMKRSYDVSVTALRLRIVIWRVAVDLQMMPAKTDESCGPTNAKVIKLEWSIESEIVYVSPDLFYQANNTLTIDIKNAVFYLFVQGTFVCIYWLHAGVHIVVLVI